MAAEGLVTHHAHTVHELVTIVNIITRNSTTKIHSITKITQHLNPITNPANEMPITTLQIL